MKESQMSEGLELRWIPVVDARGREHLEARWVDRTTHPAATHHAA